MCRGANLGTCCQRGCDNHIRCRDTGGYCDEHDPYDLGDWYDRDDDKEPEPRPVLEDDPEKRRIYTVARLEEGIRSTEASMQASALRLKEMTERLQVLRHPPVSGRT